MERDSASAPSAYLSALIRRWKGGMDAPKWKAERGALRVQSTLPFSATLGRPERLALAPGHSSRTLCR